MLRPVTAFRVIHVAPARFHQRQARQEKIFAENQKC